MYPPHPNNGTIIYAGSATSTELTLTPGVRYYFRVWGIYEGVLSEGYHSYSIFVIGSSIIPGTYELDSIRDYSLGPGGDVASLQNMLGHDDRTVTFIGSYGWVEACWGDINRLADISSVEIRERTTYYYSLTLNPNDYIYPNELAWKPTNVDQYAISFKEPNIIRIRVTNSGPGYGNICWVTATIPEQ